LNYIKPTIPFISAGVELKHKYTIELHRCKYTDELKELYAKYEKHVHKKEDVTQDGT
jgi:arginyl-tRNA--protein-N-Asp/Glu arginylyltransferase